MKEAEKGFFREVQNHQLCRVLPASPHFSTLALFHLTQWHITSFSFGTWLGVLSDRKAVFQHFSFQILLQIATTQEETMPANSKSPSLFFKTQHFHLRCWQITGYQWADHRTSQLDVPVQKYTNYTFKDFFFPSEFYWKGSTWLN